MSSEKKNADARLEFKPLVAHWALVNSLAPIPTQRPVIAEHVARLSRRYKDTAFLGYRRVPRQPHLVDALWRLESVTARTIVLALAGGRTALDGNTTRGDVAAVVVGIRVASGNARDGPAGRAARCTACRPIVALLVHLNDIVAADGQQLARRRARRASRGTVIAGFARLHDVVAADSLRELAASRARCRVDALAARIALLLVTGCEDTIAADALAKVAIHLTDADSVHERGPLACGHTDARDNASQRRLGPVRGEQILFVVHDGACVVGTFKVEDIRVVDGGELAAPAFAGDATLGGRVRRRSWGELGAVQVEVLIAIRTLVLMA